MFFSGLRLVRVAVRRFGRLIRSLILKLRGPWLSKNHPMRRGWEESKSYDPMRVHAWYGALLLGATVGICLLCSGALRLAWIVFVQRPTEDLTPWVAFMLVGVGTMLILINGLVAGKRYADRDSTFMEAWKELGEVLEQEWTQLGGMNEARLKFVARHVLNKRALELVQYQHALIRFPLPPLESATQEMEEDFFGDLNLLFDFRILDSDSPREYFLKAEADYADTPMCQKIEIWQPVEGSVTGGYVMRCRVPWEKLPIVYSTSAGSTGAAIGYFVERHAKQLGLNIVINPNIEERPQLL